jgi:hypothetical protein
VKALLHHHGILQLHRVKALYDDIIVPSPCVIVEYHDDIIVPSSRVIVEYHDDILVPSPCVIVEYHDDIIVPSYRVFVISSWYSTITQG